MQILSHRGAWVCREDRNSAAALARALEAGFGIETDVRDRGGDLVVSHDPADAASPRLDDLLAAWWAAGHRGTLALNIKADGLAARVAELLERYKTEAFVFDMSVPDTLPYLAAGVPVFTRHSELEPAPALYGRAAGVWLDAFEGDWFTGETIRTHLDAGKQVAVVSPELHGRSPAAVWSMLTDPALRAHPGLSLCTDLPFEAQEALA